MTGLFAVLKKKAEQAGVDENVFAEKFFSSIKGIVLLDTLGDAKANKEVIEKLHTGLKILETKVIGLDNLKEVILEAIKRNSQRMRKHQSR
jgi:hypothetical protein